MGIRKRLKQHLVTKQHKVYEARLRQAALTYGEWIASVESRELPIEADAGKCMPEKDFREQFILLVYEGGRLSEQAEERLRESIACHPDGILFYGDEDVWKPGGDRREPWFKPDWSPDTFLSYFYLGSVIAVHREIWQQYENLLLSLKEEETADILTQTGLFLADGKKYSGEHVYNMCYLIADRCMREKQAQQIVHIPRILFHSAEYGMTEMPYRQLRLPAIRMQQFGSPDTKGAGNPEQDVVSVIIPSKDNPLVLRSCIESVKATVVSQPYEIIVVDNGSGEESKKQIQVYAKENNICYLYKPMEFNFSAMCNLGAEKAAGTYLLFLNDDITAAEPGWMESMVAKAVKPYVGAVGVKLLYPNSDIIQHAGITNLPMGPVHKLQFMDDTQEYYDSRNRMCRNVMAVTGACLMVKKEQYDRLGGLSEELQVAFNDVDFCFRLWEAGYYQVVCNDSRLYHHESLSRGEDESAAKWQRLMSEKEKLYQAHQKLTGRDPFYSPFLNTDGLDTAIVPAYERGKRKKADTVIPVSVGTVSDEAAGASEEILRILSEGFGNVREDACLLIRPEEIIQQDKHIHLRGYSVVLGSDNTCYSKELLLQGGGYIWKLPAEPRYRKDIADNMKDQMYVAMSGFDVQADTSGLPAGNYRIGMLAKDCCSRTRLFCWTSRMITITGEESNGL